MIDGVILHKFEGSLFVLFPRRVKSIQFLGEVKIVKIAVIQKENLCPPQRKHIFVYDIETKRSVIKIIMAAVDQDNWISIGNIN